MPFITGAEMARTSAPDREVARSPTAASAPAAAAQRRPPGSASGVSLAATSLEPTGGPTISLRGLSRRDTHGGRDEHPRRAASPGIGTGSTAVLQARWRALP